MMELMTTEEERAHCVAAVRAYLVESQRAAVRAECAAEIKHLKAELASTETLLTELLSERAAEIDRLKAENTRLTAALARNPRVEQAEIEHLKARVQELEIGK